MMHEDSLLRTSGHTISRRDFPVRVAGAVGGADIAKTRFICVLNDFACLSPNQNFRDQNLILT
jgi:hypothetical protein